MGVTVAGVLKKPLQGWVSGKVNEAQPAEQSGQRGGEIYGGSLMQIRMPLSRWIVLGMLVTMMSLVTAVSNPL